MSVVMIFNGYSFEERHFNVGDIEELEVDDAIFVLGWESRCMEFARSGAIKGKRAYGIRFLDDGMGERQEHELEALLSESFDDFELRRFTSAQDRTSWEGELDGFIAELAKRADSLTCFVDYTIMPKAMTQTLYRMLLSRDSYPKIHWGYCEGIYSSAAGNLTFDQGVADQFFPIRFAQGKGGTSVERAVIAGIGGDVKLISDLLDGPDYDHVFVISAKSGGSPELFKTAHEQKARIMREHHVPETNFRETSAHSVNDCILEYLSIVRALPRECAIEILATGPKPQAVAACAIAEKFEGSVSLLGRVPKKYSRHDVRASGNVSISTVSNFCNPDIRHLLP
ncbi:hypothetical protein [Roseovarius sp. D22-M7]|uniref:hypothetical protein n=1 Tax=Roseovarius sp. D22-M7 TaxID=3127116 RepID=UPI0030105663